MEEIIKSIRATLYDRAVSPLSGAFLVSWAIWNYRFFVFLFSDISVEAQLQHIDAHFNSEPLWLVPTFILTNGFIFPLLTALVYIYVYPFFAKFVYEYSLRQQRALREIKIKENNERILTHKESLTIFSDMSALQEKYDADMHLLRQQNTSLLEINKNLESELKTSNVQLDTLKERGDDLDNQLVDIKASLDAADKLKAAGGDSTVNVQSAVSQKKMKQSLSDVLSSKINDKNLSTYSMLKFPEFEVSNLWQERLLSDIDGMHYKYIEDLDHVVNKASIAVEHYQNDNPALFNYSTDFITKSLGFVDKDFRRIHSWDENTLAAFERYEHLLDKSSL